MMNRIERLVLGWLYEEGHVMTLAYIITKLVMAGVEYDNAKCGVKSMDWSSLVLIEGSDVSLTAHGEGVWLEHRRAVDKLKEEARCQN